MNKNPKMKTPSIHHFLSPFHFININGIYTLQCLTFQAKEMWYDLLEGKNVEQTLGKKISSGIVMDVIAKILAVSFSFIKLMWEFHLYSDPEV